MLDRLKSNKVYLSLLVVAILIICAWSLINTQAALAADAVVPTGLYISATSSNSLTITWSGGTNSTSTLFLIASSTDGINFSTSTQATSTPAGGGLGNNASSTWSGLKSNTRYWFRVAATNNIATTTFISTNGYTLAATPGTPTAGTPTDATMPLTIVDANNPSGNTTYSIYNNTSNNFIDVNGASSVSRTWYSTSSWITAGGAITGLSPNTSYQFVVSALNNDASSTVSSTASTATYTNASVPSSLVATVNSEVQITVNWSGDATNYYAVNSSKGTNSGWISDKSWVSSGLACGTTYSFSVTGRNADSSLTTDAATVSATTNTCSGGGFVAPAAPAAAIGNSVTAVSGAVSGSSVVLNLSAPEAVSMAISENSNFTGASWEPYSSSKAFDLSSGAGEKTIYVKFRYANYAESSVKSLTVNKTSIAGLNINSADTIVSTSNIAISATGGEVQKISAKDRPAVYYVSGGKKYLFVNRVTYTTWATDLGDTANKFSTLKAVSQTDFDNLPFGGNLTAKPGSLIKFDDGAAVYGVGTGAKLYKLADTAAQKALYGTATPIVIQNGFKADYFDNGNAVSTLTSTSVKPE